MSSAAGGNEAGGLADVLLRNDVRAAAARIGMDGLPVREDHHRQNRGDDERDGAGEAERADACTTMSTRRISSVAYATDESGSEESTARPVCATGVRDGPGGRDRRADNDTLDQRERLRGAWSALKKPHDRRPKTSHSAPVA